MTELERIYSNELSDEDEARTGCFVIYSDGATPCDYPDLWVAAKHAAHVIKSQTSVIRWGMFQHLDELTLANGLFHKFLESGRIDLRGLTSL